MLRGLSGTWRVTMSLRIAVDNGRDKHDNYSHIRRSVIMTDNRGELVLSYFVESV